VPVIPGTLQATPFKDVIEDSGVLSKTLQRFYLEYSPKGTDLLEQLKEAKTFNLSEGESALKAFDIPSPHLGITPRGTPQTVYVRSFYDRLFTVMWRNRRAVLIGNPGVSKSWFQWYMMYRLSMRISTTRSLSFDK